MILATLCYIKDSNCTLMLKRNKRVNDVHIGKWNGVGGKLMPGESPDECVLREVKEETGLSLIKPTLCGLLTFPLFTKNNDWYVFVYTADSFTGQLHECDEGELHWIADDKLLELPLWEGDPYFLEWIRQGRFFSAKFIYENGHYISHSVTFPLES